MPDLRNVDRHSLFSAQNVSKYPYHLDPLDSRGKNLENLQRGAKILLLEAGDTGIWSHASLVIGMSTYL